MTALAAAWMFVAAGAAPSGCVNPHGWISRAAYVQVAPPQCPHWLSTHGVLKFRTFNRT